MIGKFLRFNLFIGSTSSNFAYLPFFMMLCVFDCWPNPALVGHAIVTQVVKTWVIRRFGE